MPIFGTSTFCLLTYLKIRKIEVGKISPPTHPSTHPPTHQSTPPLTPPPTRTIKVFEDFRKADYQPKIETSIFVSKPHIKMERLSSGPSRALLSQFPSGDKFIFDLGDYLARTRLWGISNIKITLKWNRSINPYSKHICLSHTAAFIIWHILVSGQKQIKLPNKSRIVTTRYYVGNNGFECS